MNAVFHPCNYPKEYNFEEYCVWCDNFIPVVIDNEDCQHYKLECPVCGEPMMLCTLCKDDIKENGGMECDFADDTCFRRRAGV